MPPRYRRSGPDGRITDYRHDQGPREPPAHAAALEIMRPFIAACEAVLPDDPAHGNTRLGLFVFLLGAADRLWQREGLDDARFPAFAEQLLRARGVPATAASTLSFTLPQLRGIEIARDMLLEGAAAMDDWLASRDGNRVLRLPELLADWQDDALPLFRA
jgi:hypothetical protein